MDRGDGCKLVGKGKKAAVFNPGEIIGEWTIIEKGKPTKARQPTFLCRCSCGTVKEVRSCHLAGKVSLCCGCIGAAKNAAKAKHITKEQKTLANVWSHCKERCHNPKNRQYPDYGARGIYVCDEWRYDSVAFTSWALDNGYKQGLELDRRDNNGPYAPWNCRFITKAENARNKRNSIKGVVFGEDLVVAQARDKYNLPHHLLYEMVKSQPLEEVVKLLIKEQRKEIMKLCPFLKCIYLNGAFSHFVDTRSPDYSSSIDELGRYELVRS